jgi:hypothetical protein
MPGVEAPQVLLHGLGIFFQVLVEGAQVGEQVMCERVAVGTLKLLMPDGCFLIGLQGQSTGKNVCGYD